jgi:hypothetical protein
LIRPLRGSTNNLVVAPFFTTVIRNHRPRRLEATVMALPEAFSLTEAVAAEDRSQLLASASTVSFFPQIIFLTGLDPEGQLVSPADKTDIDDPASPCFSPRS